MSLKIDGHWFKDEFGRTLLLRGVNLAGSSKVPTCPDGRTHLNEGFFNHREVSFVGRPFPLEEADEHFARLRSWGFTFLRFLVTWEAIEHAGPGLYDEAYLDYVTQVVAKAGEYGIRLFIDPHQDVWSRFSGGDGAPGWTFEAAGMDLTHFQETGAALVHNLHGDPYPRMIWATNYNKLASLTMFALFFGGDHFAPQARVDGEPVQEYLQRHYCAAFQELARRLKGLPAVVGYDTMNEPDAGMIGREFWSRGKANLGVSPSLWQSILLGAGLPQQVDILGITLAGLRRVDRQLVNSQGLSAWLEAQECVWKRSSVWDLDDAGRPRLLRPDHFTTYCGQEVSFHRDYLKPFTTRFIQSMRAVDPQALIFLEGAPMQTLEHLCWEPDDAPDVVHAAHWYDLVSLTLKTYIPWVNFDYRRIRPVIGASRVLRTFIAQLADLHGISMGKMNGCPTFLGEFGTPFDMNGKRAYRTGDFSRQTRALDTTFRALEANLLSGTLWNYTPDNSNAHGDGWNGEDLSVFSRDQITGSGSLDDGGRGLEAAVRPYTRAVAGEPLRVAFDYRRRVFEFEFRHDPAVTAPTEVYVPRFQYPQAPKVMLSDGEYELDQASQTLIYRHDFECPVHTLRLEPIRQE